MRSRKTNPLETLADLGWGKRGWYNNRVAKFSHTIRVNYWIFSRSLRAIEWTLWMGKL